MAATHPFYYLIHLQYLGFRYHGWHKQSNAKTVQGVVEKTLAHVLGHRHFKTLGSSRTDARVSAMHAAFELFSREPLDPVSLLEGLNYNFPSDIRALEVEEVDQKFNIIQSPKKKEYVYLFSHGAKNHPFCAPFMVYMPEPLNMERMMEGAKLFEGTHYFQSYCYKPSPDTIFEREITLSEIRENDLYTASFFPEKSYIYHVHGKGFLRHQVRLMMGTLFALGKEEITLNDIHQSLLNSSSSTPLVPMAPQYGLMLNRIHFDKS